MEKVNKRTNIRLVIVFCFICSSIISCSNQNQTNSYTANLGGVNKNISDKSILDNINNQEISDLGEAKFDDYKYQYKREGERTVAIFAEKFLPRNDTIVVGAIRAVVKQTYNENLTGSPSLKQQGELNKIYFEGKKSNFYVNLIKQDTGEVHSLVIERELK